MLRGRIRELAAARVRYGYFCIYILLRREGWRINHKRVHRLYRLEGLSMRLKRPRRHVMAAYRQNRPAAGAINENWSMDFVSMPCSTGVASGRSPWWTTTRAKVFPSKLGRASPANRWLR